MSPVSTTSPICNDCLSDSMIYSYSGNNLNTKAIKSYIVISKAFESDDYELIECEAESTTEAWNKTQEKLEFLVVDCVRKDSIVELSDL